MFGDAFVRYLFAHELVHALEDQDGLLGEDDEEADADDAFGLEEGMADAVAEQVARRHGELAAAGYLRLEHLLSDPRQKDRIMCRYGRAAAWVRGVMTASGNAAAWQAMHHPPHEEDVCPVTWPDADAALTERVSALVPAVKPRNAEGTPMPVHRPYASWWVDTDAPAALAALADAEAFAADGLAWPTYASEYVSAIRFATEDAASRFLAGARVAPEERFASAAKLSRAVAEDGFRTVWTLPPGWFWEHWWIEGGKPHGANLAAHSAARFGKEIYWIRRGDTVLVVTSLGSQPATADLRRAVDAFFADGAEAR
jgi:hypothetical protein